jgi:hypothetical protein
MLFTNTVAPQTMHLLKMLMAIPELAAFPLVGGTNLSLRFGHRMSVDLDLFTNAPFDLDETFDTIVRAFPKTIKLDARKQSLWLSINGVKVDLILHQYPYVRGIETIDDIHFLAVEDIIPMKLEAMATRGVKKDFWDIAELLTHYPLVDMLQFHQQRYRQTDMGHLLLSATYFDDAEKERIDPICLTKTTWEDVKDTMRQAVDDYVKSQL